ncbi:flagellar biosynthetic protein FliQ, partial [Treponema pallidum]
MLTMLQNYTVRLFDIIPQLVRSGPV